MKTRKQLEDRYEFLKSQLKEARSNFVKADAKSWNGWYRRWNETTGKWETDASPCENAERAYRDASAEFDKFVRDIINMVPVNEI